MLPGMSAADVRWCEQVARHLLAEMEAEHATRVTAEDVCAAFGLRHSARSPSGCRGILTGDALRLPAKGRPESRARGAQHEVGHFAAQLYDPDMPAHPEEAMGWVGLCVEVPRRAAIDAVQAHGFDPEALARRFPGLFVADVLTRCAVATGGLAVLVRARSETRWAANDAGPEEALGVELRVRALAASARQRDRLVEAGGWVATPVREPGRYGVLVIRR
jgi:hypothetical protein